MIFLSQEHECGLIKETELLVILTANFGKEKKVICKITVFILNIYNSIENKQNILFRSSITYPFHINNFKKSVTRYH